MKSILIFVGLASMAHAQIVIGGGVVFGGGNSASPTWVDPVVSYNAAGVNTTTTGSITSGGNTLTIASASGWSAGMGVAVAGAGAAGVELVCAKSTISGTTITLLTSASAACNAGTTVSGNTVNHDDTYAISQAIASGSNVYLHRGNYNVTCPTAAAIFTVSSPIMFVGDGSGLSTIYRRCAAQDVFNISYEAAGGYNNGSSGTKVSALFSDFGVFQGTGITPTAKSAFNVASASGAGFYVSGLHIERIQMNQLYRGITTGTGVLSNWYRDNFFIGFASGGNCIVVNTPSPSGDNHFNDNECTGSNTGILVLQNDSMELSNNKFNGSNFVVQPLAATSSVGLRITNQSIESGTITLDATGGTIRDPEFTGGECGFNCGGLAATSVSGLLINGMQFRDSTAGVSLSGGTAKVFINYDGSGAAITLTNSAQAAIVEPVYVQATTPACTVAADVGGTWYNTTTTTTVFRVCLNVAGTVQWVTK